MYDLRRYNLRPIRDVPNQVGFRLTAVRQDGSTREITVTLSDGLHVFAEEPSKNFIGWRPLPEGIK